MDEAKALLEALTAGIRQAAGAKLLGLYLWGSYVLGDFDPRRSDVDLVAALAADVSGEDFAALKAMHDALALRFPAWEGRIEVAYATVATLDRPAEGGEIVRISPGEPLNRRRSDERWVVDWYVVRERGIALCRSAAGAAAGAHLAPAVRRVRPRERRLVGRPGRVGQGAPSGRPTPSCCCAARCGRRGTATSCPSPRPAAGRSGRFPSGRTSSPAPSPGSRPRRRHRTHRPTPSSGGSWRRCGSGSSTSRGSGTGPRVVACARGRGMAHPSRKGGASMSRWPTRQTIGMRPVDGR